MSHPRYMNVWGNCTNCNGMSMEWIKRLGNLLAKGKPFWGDRHWSNYIDFHFRGQVLALAYPLEMHL